MMTKHSKNTLTRNRMIKSIENISIFIGVIFVICMIGCSQTVHAMSDAATLETIMDGLNRIVANNKEIDDRINTPYFLMKKKLYAGTLKIEIRSDFPSDIYNGAQFLYKDTEAFIGISPYLLKIYLDHPSIVYSCIVHELYHAYCYFHDFDRFLKVRDNNMEHYMYEMDASFVEGLFIKKYLQPNFYSLTKYEKDLIRSMDTDGLGSYSAVFRGYSRELAYDMVHASDDTSLTVKEKLNVISNIGEQVVNSFNIKTDDSDWHKYQSVVIIYTLCDFLPQVIYNIDNAEQDYALKPADFSWDKHKDMKKLYDKAMELYKGHEDYYHDYGQKLIKKYQELD